MGLRYLLLILALWGLFLIIRHLIRQRRDPRNTPVNAKSVDSVQCEHCGLHLPRNEALRQGERYYCNQAHLEASEQKPRPDE